MTESRVDEGSSLFERLCQVQTLQSAFTKVKENKGAPGVDGVTISAFEAKLNEELGQLVKEISSWTYQPMPVRRVDIPKPGGGTRMLGIASVRDRVVQTAIKRLLEPILDPLFSEHSYGFRPGRSQEQAVIAAQRFVQLVKSISWILTSRNFSIGFSTIVSFIAWDLSFRISEYSE